MSEESENSLSALPVSELRARCAARGIDTAGLAEKADLVAVLLGTDADMYGASAAQPGQPEPETKGATKGVEVMAAFAERFHCQAVADDATRSMKFTTKSPQRDRHHFASWLAGSLETVAAGSLVVSNHVSSSPLARRGTRARRHIGAWGG